MDSRADHRRTVDHEPDPSGVVVEATTSGSAISTSPVLSENIGPAPRP